MIRCFLLLAILGFCCITRTVWAQTTPDWEQVVQDLAALPEDDRDYGDLFEMLYQVYAHPVDLNKATEEDLKPIYFLSEKQQLAIIQHRERFGDFLSVYELQAVEGIDGPTARRLLPFVAVRQRGGGVSSRKFWGRLSESTQHFALLRQERVLQQQDGFRAPSDTLPADYQGNPYRTYFRYRLASPKDYSIGITAEQDVGEPWGAMPNKPLGPDFLSAHIALYNRGKLKQLVIGDFQVQVGQGLALAGGFGVGKGGETVLSTRRSSRGVLPYTSVTEAGFLRGIAAQYALTDRWSVTVLASVRRQDATLSQGYAGDTARLFASSIQETGFHRTETELSRRKQLGETTLGASIQYQQLHWEAGWTTLFTRFEHPFSRRRLDYNQFAFRGQQNILQSAHARAWLGSISAFGEVGRSSSGGFGGIGGLVASIAPQVDAALLLRHYDRHFHSFYGDPFGETTGGNNEQGAYLGMKIRPKKQWEIAAYTDIFRFPWLRFQQYAPANGSEWLLKAQWKPHKKLVASAQLRGENRPRNLSASLTEAEGIKETVLVPMQRWNAQIHLDFQPDDRWVIQSRVLLNAYGQQGASLPLGYAIIQDITGNFGPVRLSARFAMFETDWETRVYAYEKDVLYAFSFPAYYGQGFRQVYVLKWGFSKRLDLWMRFAQTTFADRDQVSSGTQAIRGNTRSEVKLQVMYQLN